MLSSMLVIKSTIGPRQSLTQYHFPLNGQGSLPNTQKVFSLDGSPHRYLKPSQPRVMASYGSTMSATYSLISCSVFDSIFSTACQSKSNNDSQFETYPMALRHHSSIPFSSIFAPNSFTLSTSWKANKSSAPAALPGKTAVGETSW